MNVVGEKVRELREEQGWLQDELAQRSGLARNTISRIEMGRLSPTVDSVTALAGALGVEPGDLFPKAQAFDPKTFRVPPVEEFDLDKLESEILTRTQPESRVQLRERAREVLTVRYTERELMELRDIYIARAKELAPTEPFEADVDLDAYATAVTVANLASRALERVAGRQPA
jgi:transcriptional regulator with XRE-family HTH domain